MSSTIEIDLLLKKQQFDAEINRAKSQVKALESHPVAPKVDLRELHDLNRLYDKKMSHHKQVVDFVKRNPVAPNYDGRSIRTGMNELRSFNTELSRIKTELGAGGNIRANINQNVRVSFGRHESMLAYEMRKVGVDIGRDIAKVVDAIHGLKPSLLSRAAGLVGRVITAPARVAANLAGGAIGNIFTGYTEGIGRALFKDTGLSMTMNASRQAKKFTEILDKEVIGRDKAYATFFAEFFRSGSIDKAFSRAMPRTEGGKIYERLMKLQEIVTQPTLKKSVEKIREDDELEEIFRQSGGDMRRFLENAQPKNLSQNIVNPVVEEFRPLLRFIQDIRAARTAMESDKVYNERKAGFPVLDQYSSVVSVSGGAQFKGGQGGRNVAMGLGIMSPEVYFMPVENPDTDITPGEEPEFEKWLKTNLFNKIPGMSADFSNTAINLFRQVNTSLNPFGYSTAAAQGLANTRLAQEQKIPGSFTSFSLGGVDALAYARAQQYMGLGSNALAMNYPYLNMLGEKPQGFNSAIVAQDPLTFPMIMGLGSPEGIYNLGGRGVIGTQAHHYKHLFKDEGFADTFYRTIGANRPDLSATDRGALIEVGEKLYEILGAAQQFDSITTTGQFDMKSPFNSFMTASTGTSVSVESMLSKFFEWERVLKLLQHKDNPSPAVTQIYESLAAYFTEIQKRVVERLEQIGFSPPDPTNITGFQKFQSEAGSQVAYIQEMWRGNLSPERLQKFKEWKSINESTSIPWFKNSTQVKTFGKEYVDKIVQAYLAFGATVEEYERTAGKISDDFINSLEFPEYSPVPENVKRIFAVTLDTSQLPKEEVARISQLGLPAPFEKKQSAILAFNQLQKAIPDILPSIDQIQAIGAGMSGAITLLGKDLTYKTDLDPGGLGKIASEQEVKAYKRLQGRLSPLLYAAKPGQALVTERIHGRPLKDILDRIAKPIKELQKKRDELTSAMESSEDVSAIKKYRERIDQLTKQIDRNKKRFNKAAGILYKQAGQLGAALQQMGVVHNDLASGNVFFAQGGARAIDLGNATVVQPGQTMLSPQQRIGDFTTAVQRSVIDRDYYGILNPLEAVTALVAGYMKPMAIPKRRQIDPTLLSPVQKAKPVQIGTDTPSLVYSTIPNLSGVTFPVRPVSPVVDIPTSTKTIPNATVVANSNTSGAKEGGVVQKIYEELVKIRQLLNNKYPTPSDPWVETPTKGNGIDIDGELVVSGGGRPAPPSPAGALFKLPDDAAVRKGAQMAIWNTFDSVSRFYKQLQESEKAFLSKMPRLEAVANLTKAVIPPALLAGGMAEAGMLDDYVLGVQAVFEHILQTAGQQGIEVLMNNMNQDAADLLQGIYDIADSAIKTDATGFGSQITNAIGEKQLELLRSFLNLIKEAGKGSQGTIEATLQALNKVGSDVAGQLLGAGAAAGGVIVGGNLAANVAGQAVEHVGTEAIIQQIPAEEEDSQERIGIQGSIAVRNTVPVKLPRDLGAINPLLEGLADPERLMSFNRAQQANYREAKSALTQKPPSYKKAIAYSLGAYEQTSMAASYWASRPDQMPVVGNLDPKKSGTKQGYAQLAAVAGEALKTFKRTIKSMEGDIGNIDGSTLRFLVKKMQDMGIEIPAGLRDGIRKYASQPKAEQEKLAKGVIDITKKVFKIKSPSWVFFKIAEDNIQGGIDGVKSSGPKLIKEYVKLAENAALVFRATLTGLVADLEINTLPSWEKPRYPSIPNPVAMNEDDPQVGYLRAMRDESFDPNFFMAGWVKSAKESRQMYLDLNRPPEYPDIVKKLNELNGTTNTIIEMDEYAVNAARARLEKNDQKRIEYKDNPGMLELFNERDPKYRKQLEEAESDLRSSIEREEKYRNESIKKLISDYYRRIRAYRETLDHYTQQVEDAESRLRQEQKSRTESYVGYVRESTGRQGAKRKKDIVGSLTKYYADKREYDSRLTMGTQPSPLAGAIKKAVLEIAPDPAEIERHGEAIQLVFALRIRDAVESYLQQDSRVSISPEFAKILKEIKSEISGHVDDLIALSRDWVLGYSIDAGGDVGAMRLHSLGSLGDKAGLLHRDIDYVNSFTPFHRELEDVYLGTRETTPVVPAELREKILPVIQQYAKVRPDYKPDESLLAARESFEYIEASARRIDEDIAGWGKHGRRVAGVVQESIEQQAKEIESEEKKEKLRSIEQRAADIYLSRFLSSSSPETIVDQVASLSEKPIDEVLGWLGGVTPGLSLSDKDTLSQLREEYERNVGVKGSLHKDGAMFAPGSLLGDMAIEKAVNPGFTEKAGISSEEYKNYQQNYRMAVAAVVKHQMSSMGMLEKTKLLARIPVELIPVITGKSKNPLFHDVLQRLQDEAYVSGRFVGEGLGKGIENSKGESTAAITKVAKGVITTAESVLEEKSPSRVFMRIGRYIVEGLQQGLSVQDLLGTLESDLQSEIQSMIADTQNIRGRYAGESPEHYQAFVTQQQEYAGRMAEILPNMDLLFPDAETFISELRALMTSMQATSGEAKVHMGDALYALYSDRMSSDQPAANLDAGTSQLRRQQRSNVLSNLAGRYVEADDSMLPINDDPPSSEIQSAVGSAFDFRAIVNRFIAPVRRALIFLANRIEDSIDDTEIPEPEPSWTNPVAGSSFDTSATTEVGGLGVSPLPPPPTGWTAGNAVAGSSLDTSATTEFRTTPPSSLDTSAPTEPLSTSGRGVSTGVDAVAETGVGLDPKAWVRRQMQRIRDAIRGSGTNVAEDFWNTINAALDGVEYGAETAGEGVRGLVNVIGALSDADPGIAKVVETFKGLGVGLFALIGYQQFEEVIAQFARTSVAAALDVERFKVALSYSSGGAISELQNIKNLSNEIGANFLTSAENYSKLSIAAANTNVEGQVQPIFEGFTRALVAQGATPEEQGRAFLAVEQMIGKGQIMAEELRQQLAEVMPQATGALARAKGLTPQQLTRRMRQEALMPEQDLLLLATQLEVESTIPLANYEASPLKAYAELQNKTQTIQAGVGGALLNTQAIQAANAVLTPLANNIDLVANAAVLGAGVIGVGFLGALYALIVNTRLGSVALKMMGLEFITNNFLLNLWNGSLGQASSRLMIANVASNKFAVGLGVMSGALNLLAKSAPLIAVSAAIYLVTKGWSAMNTELKKVADQSEKTLKKLKELQAERNKEKPESDVPEGDWRRQWVFGEYDNNLTPLQRAGLNAGLKFIPGYGAVETTRQLLKFDPNRNMGGLGEVLDEKGNRIGPFERTEQLTNREQGKRILNAANQEYNLFRKGMEGPGYEQYAKEKRIIDVEIAGLNVALQRAQLSNDRSLIPSLSSQLAKKSTERAELMQGQFATNAAAAQKTIEALKEWLEFLESDTANPEREQLIESANIAISRMEYVVNDFAAATSGATQGLFTLSEQIKQADQIIANTRWSNQNYAIQADINALKEGISGALNPVDLQRTQLRNNVATTDIQFKTAQVLIGDNEKRIRDVETYNPEFAKEAMNLSYFDRFRKEGMSLSQMAKEIDPSVIDQALNDETVEQNLKNILLLVKRQSEASRQLSEAEKANLEAKLEQLKYERERVIRIRQANTQIASANTAAEIARQYTQGNVGDVARAQQVAENRIEDAKAQLKQAIQNSKDNVLDPADAATAIAEARKAVAEAEADLVNSQRSIEDTHRQTSREVTDLNRAIVDAGIDARRQIRDAAWEIADSVVGMIKQTRDLEESWYDLNETMEVKLAEAQNDLVSAQDKIKQIKYKTQIEELSPFDNNIGRRVNTILSNLFESLDSNESETRQLDVQQRNIQQEYITTLRNIRNELEKQKEAEIERSRSIIRLNEKYTDIIINLDKALDDLGRRIQDVKINTGRSIPESADQYIQQIYAPPQVNPAADIQTQFQQSTQGRIYSGNEQFQGNQSSPITREYLILPGGKENTAARQYWITNGHLPGGRQPEMIGSEYVQQTNQPVQQQRPNYSAVDPYNPTPAERASYPVQGQTSPVAPARVYPEPTQMEYLEQVIESLPALPESSQVQQKYPVYNGSGLQGYYTKDEIESQGLNTRVPTNTTPQGGYRRESLSEFAERYGGSFTPPTAVSQPSPAGINDIRSSTSTGIPGDPPLPSRELQDMYVRQGLDRWGRPLSNLGSGLGRDVDPANYVPSFEVAPARESYQQPQSYQQPASQGFAVTAQQAFTPESLKNAVQMIAAESGGEPMAGKVAVAIAMLNRLGLMLSGNAPTGTGGWGAKDKTLNSVLFARNAKGGYEFSPLKDGRFYNQYSPKVLEDSAKAFDYAVKILYGGQLELAKQLGINEIAVNSTNFRRKELGREDSVWRGEHTQIKDHIFGRDKFSINKDMPAINRRVYEQQNGVPMSLNFGIPESIKLGHTAQMGTRWLFDNVTRLGNALNNKTADEEIAKVKNIRELAWLFVENDRDSFTSRGITGLTVDIGNRLANNEYANSSIDNIQQEFNKFAAERGFQVPGAVIPQPAQQSSQPVQQSSQPVQQSSATVAQAPPSVSKPAQQSQPQKATATEGYIPDYVNQAGYRAPITQDLLINGINPITSTSELVKENYIKPREAISPDSISGFVTDPAPIQIKDPRRIEGTAHQVFETQKQALEAKRESIFASSSLEYKKTLNELSRVTYDLADQNNRLYQEVHNASLKYTEMTADAKGYRTAMESINLVGMQVEKTFDDLLMSAFNQDQDLGRQLAQLSEGLRLAEEELQKEDLTTEQKEAIRERIELIKTVTGVTEKYRSSLAGIANAQDAERNSTKASTIELERQSKVLAAQKLFAEKSASYYQTRYDVSPTNSLGFGVLINPAPIIKARMDADEATKALEESLRESAVPTDKADELRRMQEEANKLNIKRAFVEATPFLAAFSSELRDVILNTTSIGDAFKKLGNMVLGVILEQLTIKPLQNFIAQAIAPILGLDGPQYQPIQTSQGMLPSQVGSMEVAAGVVNINSGIGNQVGGLSEQATRELRSQFGSTSNSFNQEANNERVELFSEMVFGESLKNNAFGLDDIEPVVEVEPDEQPATVIQERTPESQQIEKNVSEIKLEQPSLDDVQGAVQVAPAEEVPDARAVNQSQPPNVLIIKQDQSATPSETTPVATPTVPDPVLPAEQPTEGKQWYEDIPPPSQGNGRNRQQDQSESGSVNKENALFSFLFNAQQSNASSPNVASSPNKLNFPVAQESIQASAGSIYLNNPVAQAPESRLLEKYSAVSSSVERMMWEEAQRVVDSKRESIMSSETRQVLEALETILVEQEESGLLQDRTPESQLIQKYSEMMDGLNRFSWDDVQSAIQVAPVESDIESSRPGKEIIFQRLLEDTARKSAQSTPLVPTQSTSMTVEKEQSRITQSQLVQDRTAESKLLQLLTTESSTVQLTPWDNSQSAMQVVPTYDLGEKKEVVVTRMMEAIKQVQQSTQTPSVFQNMLQSPATESQLMQSSGVMQVLIDSPAWDDIQRVIEVAPATSEYSSDNRFERVTQSSIQKIQESFQKQLTGSGAVFNGKTLNQNWSFDQSSVFGGNQESSILSNVFRLASESASQSLSELGEQAEAASSTIDSDFFKAFGEKLMEPMLEGKIATDKVIGDFTDSLYMATEMLDEIVTNFGESGVSGGGTIVSSTTEGKTHVSYVPSSGSVTSKTGSIFDLFGGNKSTLAATGTQSGNQKSHVGGVASKAADSNPLSGIGAGLMGIAGGIAKSFIPNNWIGDIGRAALGLFGFAKGGSVQEAMQKERMQSGREPILAVLNKDEYVIPANEATQYLQYKSWQSIKSQDVKIKNFAGGGFVDNSKNVNWANTNTSGGSNVFINNKTTIQVKDPNDIGLSAKQIERQRKISAEKALV
jgi:tape measure domain-containing protein